MGVPILLYREEVWMRGRQPPASPLYPKIRFAFTDHPITVWAGAILLRLYFELLGLRTALTGVLAPLAKTSQQSDSRRGCPAGLVVWAGAGRRAI